MTRQLSAADKVLLLLSIVPYLHANGPTSISELSQTFGVEPQTLRKLARFLGTAGLPGETLTYQANDLFDIDWTALEEHDEVHLVHVVACEDAPRFSRVEIAALQAGIQSLIPALPDSLVAVAHSTSEKLAALTDTTVDRTSVSIDPEPATQALSAISEAISKKHRLTFTYRDRAGVVTQREVDPYESSQVRGDWYLHAYCHSRQENRTFRIDSISQVVLLRDRKVDAQHNMESRVQPKHAHNRSTSAQILVHTEVLYLLDGWEPHIIETLSDDRIRAEVSLAYEANVIDLVTIAPGLIEVEAPSMLRNLVHTWLNGLHAGSPDTNTVK